MRCRRSDRYHSVFYYFDLAFKSGNGDLTSSHHYFDCFNHVDNEPPNHDDYDQVTSDNDHDETATDHDNDETSSDHDHNEATADYDHDNQIALEMEESKDE